MKTAHIVSMCVLGLALGALAPEAGAQGAAKSAAGEEAKPAPKLNKRQARRRARKRFFESQEMMQKEQFDQAIAALEEAYSLDPQNLHLFNLGLAHYLKGAKEQSLGYFQEFLAAKPRDRGLIREARRFVRILERDVVIIREARAQAEEEAAQARQETAQARQAAEEASAARRQAESQAAAARTETGQARAERDRWKRLALERPSPGAGKRMLGSSLLLLGGLAVGVGAYYGLVARSANDELQSATQWQVSYDWYVDRAESFDQRMLVFSLAGAGLVAAGATLYYLGEREAGQPLDEQDALRLMPSVSARSAGVQMLGRF